MCSTRHIRPSARNLSLHAPMELSAQATKVRKAGRPPSKGWTSMAGTGEKATAADALVGFEP
eukprot:15431239-Alexandrium_andersonii.AAC.1